jgi:hypothetical protein
MNLTTLARHEAARHLKESRARRSPHYPGASYNEAAHVTLGRAATWAAVDTARTLLEGATIDACISAEAWSALDNIHFRAESAYLHHCALARAARDAVEGQ